MKIGIIIGSVREGRTGAAVAEWFAQVASTVEGADFEIIDLKSFDLPILTAETLPGMADKQYEDERVQRWSAAIDAMDAFVFVTPEYNHGVPGAFKNAFDSLGPEWNDKAVAFVSYGADNGIRAVEQWRAIVSNFHMPDARTQLALSLFTDFAPEGGLADPEGKADKARAVASDLVTLARRMVSSR